ncbi:hypothetical protein EDD11_003421 [Mortierella claussenii]|nr:hypothetical protein EDD11_003421 [Mortierella claussenii]
MGSYFDLVKPISIPNTTSIFHSESEDIDGLDHLSIRHGGDDDDENTTVLPEYLQSFHDSGISTARLKRFNWLHPKNYSGDGSLNDDYTLSPYGTSVSSPRGEAWEIVDHGPRKGIDELWDEVFEYQERIKLLEQVHQVQAAAAAAAVDKCDPSSVAGRQLQDSDIDELEVRQRCKSIVVGGEERWPDYDSGIGLSGTTIRSYSIASGSDACYSPLFMTLSSTSASASPTSSSPSFPAPNGTSSLSAAGSTVGGSRTAVTALGLLGFAKSMAVLDEMPMSVSSGTIAQIDRTPVYASRKGVRSDRGSALRLLSSAFRAYISR